MPPAAIPSPHSLPAGTPVPDLRKPREIAITVAITMAFNVLIAAVLTAVRATGHGFGSHLVFSQSIGLAIVAWAVVLFRLPVPEGASLRTTWLLRLVPAILLGFTCGLALASWLVGAPFSLSRPSAERTTAALATMIASAFLGYLAWIRQSLAREASARAEAQHTAAEAELRLLRAQLEPHMLFNTLATLHTLIDEDPALARHMLDRLITWLRWSLAASRSEWTTLGEEFAHLRAWLELMALRMGPRLRVQVELDERLAATPVPPMLLQPLVENAIRHGLEPALAGGTLALSARRDGDSVEVSVTDSGPGMPATAMAAAAAARAAAAADRTAAAHAAGPSDGYGLEHVRQRLRATYGARAALVLSAIQPHGVRACVRIPA